MKLTDSEWQIMNCLWAGHRATARQISDKLPKKTKWAYTTIKTLLSRLVEKGAVKESKDGNTSVYEPIITRQAARRKALMTLVNQAFDGAFGQMMHFFLEDKALNNKQRKKLLEIIKQAEDIEKEKRK